MALKLKTIRCLVALTDKQKDSVDLFARNISRKREADNLCDRITISTVVRCLIDAFMERWGEIDLEEIYHEEELLKRIRELYSDKTSK